MHDSVHQIYVASSRDAVFDALTSARGVRSWWTSDCQFTHDAETTIAEVGFNRRNVVMRLAIRDSGGSRVSWRCQSGPAEWLGSEISFELQSVGASETSVVFRQSDGNANHGIGRQLNGYWNAALIRLKAFVEGRCLGPLHDP